MKLGLALIGALGSVHAFTDCVRVTVPDEGVLARGYIQLAATFGEELVKFTSKVCGENGEFIVYKVPAGAIGDRSSVNVQGAGSSWSMDTSCTVVTKQVNSIDDVDLLGSNWLVEESLGQSLMFANIKYYLDRRFAKREVLAEDSDEDMLALSEEIKADFDAAHKLLEEEGDQPVWALSSDGPSDGDLKIDNGTGLFSEYQFFTLGLLTIIFVLLFLVYVLFTAISWIADIQITYSSFEKQVSIQKKTD